jgi:hypothetical protein
MSRHTTRLPSPALVIAVFALLVALGGTGYALAAIPKHSVGAAELKKNAVRSKAVKDHALKAKDFKAGQLPPSEVLVKNSGDGVTVTTVLGVGADTVIRSMSLSAGTYYVRATVVGINQHAVLQGELRCYLRSSGDVLVTGIFGLFVPIEPNAGTNTNRGFFSLDAAYQLAAPGTVSVECNKAAPAQAITVSASLAAFKTAQVTAVP